MKRLLLVASACLALAACATSTPYQPLAVKGPATGGYSEVKVDQGRFRISFSGNTLTSRETVERYLLYRAAEVTVDQGYDWFSLADRHTDKKSSTYYTGSPWGYDTWRPTWAYLGHGRWTVINTWQPYGLGYSRFGGDYEQEDKFEASAEIVLGKGPKPAGDVAAFDAHEVVKNLGPSIVRPATS